MDARQLTNQLKQAAQSLGFSLAGVCPAEAPASYDRLLAWLAAGYAGKMDYIDRRRDAYRHPNAVLDGVRSVLMLAYPYDDPSADRRHQPVGRVARYAQLTNDYHDTIHDKLKVLIRRAKEWSPEVRARGVVDTAPLLEREFAQRAGLGWIGKNTMLINRTVGSWFFLAALLLDCELCYDVPQMHNYCGSCTACLDACPTDALIEAGVLDARRCISYLTIELPGEIPHRWRADIGDWLFGCDVCQDVCPWNRKSSAALPAAPVASPARQAKWARELFALNEAEFRARFRHSALWRAKRSGLLRNVAIVLGNQRCGDARDVLQQGLKDAEPVVREACAWALARINHDGRGDGS